MLAVFRKIFWVLAIMAAIGVAIPEVPVIGVETAYAQAKKKKKRRNLFQLLFKRNRKARKPNAAAARNLRRKLGINGQRRQKRRAVATAPVKPKVEKAENAAKILVVGDFMADGTAWGLGQVFADDPNVVVVSKASALSGMVRDDVIDWPASLPAMLEETKPIAVVVLVGMNDRQQMRTSAGKFNKLTEEWRKQYVARANALAAAASNTKLVWLGLPPVRKGGMNADYLVFNGIFRTAAENVGGTFVDVWDGYTNAEGKFISAGPDVNGQIVRLRSSDGINMTKAGKRKLGFYAEKAIRKATGLGTDVLLASLPNFNLPDQPSAPQYDPAKSGRTVVVSLGGPSLDGGSVLEGADEFIKTPDSDKSVSHELVSAGSAAVPKPGRIDASWGLPKVEKKPETAKKEDKTKEQQANNTSATGNEALPTVNGQSISPSVEVKPLPTVTNISN